ncbi:MAG: DNA recombination protein RmuC [Coprobacter sp.]|nr:DNA recombination protein RmuC [Coprobacter sp.]
MEIVFLIIGLAAGLLAAVAVYAVQRRNEMRWMQERAGSETRLRECEAKRQETEARLQQERLTVARLEAEVRLANERAAAQRSELETVREQMDKEFRLLANSILEEKSKRFTELNQENIGRILTPLQEKLTEFKKQVEETYDRESKERFSLDSRIRELVALNQQISQEANNLTRALKGDSKIQGDWGEMILESILEKSGLVKGREYYTQETLTDETGRSLQSEEGHRMRPDVVVVYPDKRRVIIDSKVSLTAYARYVDAERPDEGERALQEHIRSLKNHVLELAGKRYQDYVESLDFVMMFVPNEPAYLLAMQHDPTLWQFAYDHRVMLISPTNLIAALKLIVDLWNRDKQGRHAMEIARHGGLLYDKFVGFVDSMRDIGTHLDKAQRSYQQAFSQLKDGNGSLIRKVENLRKLGVKSKKVLPAGLLPEEDDPVEKPEEE